MPMKLLLRRPMYPPGFTAPFRPAKDAEAVARVAYPEEWQVNDLTEADYALFDDEIAAAIAAEQLSPMAEDGTSQLYTSYIANLPAERRRLLRTDGLVVCPLQHQLGTSYCSATAPLAATTLSRLRTVFTTRPLAIAGTPTLCLPLPIAMVLHHTAPLSAATALHHHDGMG